MKTQFIKKKQMTATMPEQVQGSAI